MRAAHTGSRARRRERRPSVFVAAVFSTALVLHGCGEMSVRESQVEQTLTPKTASIVVGQTDRAAMRQLLGEPWLASQYWQFDLFQLSGQNSALTIIFIPMLYSTEDVRGYVLVTYDEHGVVAAFGHGIAREGNTGMSTFPVSVSIRAGDIEFRASGDGERTYLAVDPPRAEAYLASFPAQNGCRILLGTVGDRCGTRVTIDGGPPVVMPTESTDWRPAWLPIEVAPGTHGVEFASDIWHCAFEGREQVSCAAAENRYAAVALTPVEATSAWQLKARLAATVTVAGAPPDAFHGHALILHANGAWRVQPEPAR